MVYPGTRLRIFVRDADGSILTKQYYQGTFSETWDRLGTFTAAGPPSADLGPNGRIQVVARAADGITYHTGETDTFSGVWGDWARTQPADDSFRAATDPTAFEYFLPDRPTWAFVVRDRTEAVRVYIPVSTASRTGGPSSVRFTPTTLPAASE